LPAIAQGNKQQVKASLYKRLEKGVFKFPEGGGASVEVESVEQALLQENTELARAKRQETPDSLLMRCSFAQSDRPSGAPGLAQAPVRS